MPRSNNFRPKKVITDSEKVTKRRLREIRKKNGLTQTDISIEYGTTPQTISNYEKCDIEMNVSPPIPIDYYLFISNKFNVSIDWIMGNDEETKIRNQNKEKFETYGEVFNALKMLFNTFENNLCIDNVTFGCGDFGMPNLYHTLNNKYENKIKELQENECFTINHVSIDNSIINNFLTMYKKQKEYLNTINDNDFKEEQSKMFFEYQIKKNNDEKIK